jgi:uncharacterized membrane protein
MAPSSFVLIANQYASEADALADYEGVRQLYADLGSIQDFDAAVLSRTATGKVDIVKTTDAPTRAWAEKGLMGGLAAGVLISLVPAVGLGAGLLLGGGLGAGLGALAGHEVGGVSVSDLEALGELLEEGTSGLAVVATIDVEAQVKKAITRAKRQVNVRLQVDPDALRKEIEAAKARRRGKSSGHKR